MAICTRNLSTSVLTMVKTFMHSIEHRLFWSPQNIYTAVLNGESIARYVCLILNRKILIPPVVVENIWENAQIRCTVDGGTNRWRYFLETECQDKQLKVPDLITGDFDSITKETFDYFESTKRVHTPDQNETDFTKAIGVLRPYLEEKQIRDIVVFQDTSGRFDQIMANINTLYKVQSPTLNVYLLSGSAITWLLRPGKHSISIPAELVEQQRWCALIPIGEPARNVTTTGLKWNLCNSVLEFGAMVSTSNTYAEEVVEIETESCLVWSMGLFCFDDSL